MCCIFLSFFPFSPLFTCTLKPGHLEQYKINFWFHPTFPLLLLALFFCCFSVINSLALEPGVFNQDQRSSDDRQWTALQYKNKGTENRAERQKVISYDLWMCLSSPKFSGHALFMFFWLYYWPHTHLEMSSVDCEITDRWNLFFAHFEPL